jgi:hypothetical protein
VIQFSGFQKTLCMIFNQNAKIIHFLRQKFEGPPLVNNLPSCVSMFAILAKNTCSIGEKITVCKIFHYRGYIFKLFMLN